MKIRAQIRTIHGTYQRFGPKEDGYPIAQMDPEIGGTPRDFETVTIEVLDIEDVPWAAKDHTHPQPAPPPNPDPQPEPQPTEVIVGHLGVEDGVFTDEGGR